MALSLATNRQLTNFPPILNAHSTLHSPSSFPSSPPINNGLISSRCIRWRMRDKFPSRNRESNPRVSETERRGLSRVCGFRSEESGSGIHSGQSESESEEEDDDDEEMGDSVLPKRWDVLGLGQAMVDFSGVVDDDFLERLGLEKGTRKIVNHEERGRVLRAMDGCSYKAAAGGSLSNTLVALARLGSPSLGSRSLNVAMAGSVGSDPLGAFYRILAHIFHATVDA